MTVLLRHGVRQANPIVGDYSDLGDPRVDLGDRPDYPNPFENEMLSETGERGAR